MPLGWYLAQGLYPLGPSSSDDEEGPCELPNGRIVCGPHGLVVCGKCCTDYSFMEENEEEDEEEDEDEDVDDHLSRRSSVEENTLQPPFDPEEREGTGRVIPTKFIPPTDSITPTELFPGRRTYLNITRFVHRNDPRAMLIFTDGACLNNGQLDPKAGWAMFHGPGLETKPAVSSGRVEKKGPFGDDGIQSSNRAELRAVIAALGFRHWVGEGFTTLVIATDSEYVVEGSTKWARTWTRNNWKTNAGANVKNQDLWKFLLGEFERWEEEGLTIKFWRISRDWNKIADAAAKEAASRYEAHDRWTKVIGLPF